VGEGWIWFIGKQVRLVFWFNVWVLKAHCISGIGGGIKFRPRPEELAEFGPEFIEYWNDVLAAKPDKPLCLLGVVSG
jgi:hypothetical protein